MNNLTVRILFALGGIPVVLFLIWFNTYTRFGMMTVLIGIGAWEWARMVSSKLDGPRMVGASPVAAAMMSIAWVIDRWVPGAVMIVGCEVLALYLFLGFLRVRIDELFPWIVLHASGPLYLGLWGGMTLKLMGTGHGFESSFPFILVMVAMWTCDTFAYIFGRLFGKHKLAPQISPKKTWEGAIGGTIFTIALIVWLGPLVFHTGLIANIFLGILLSISGQTGDLLESAIKRWAGAKDSSQVFPGHGGVLDRLDSLFLAGPLTVVVLGVIRHV